MTRKRRGYFSKTETIFTNFVFHLLACRRTSGQPTRLCLRSSAESYCYDKTFEIDSRNKVPSWSSRHRRNEKWSHESDPWTWGTDAGCSCVWGRTRKSQTRNQNEAGQKKKKNVKGRDSKRWRHQAVERNNKIKARHFLKWKTKRFQAEPNKHRTVVSERMWKS